MKKIDRIVIPPLLWVTDQNGNHYKWEDCVLRNFTCSMKDCENFCMCDAMTLPYEGDRSKALIKEIKH